jgi:uncharacterized BrkB/YihY/UPF0761 family membrane protein
MTATVTDVIIATIRSSTPDTLASTFGVILIMLLLVLLLQKELVRAYDASRSRKWLQTLNVAILPLLIAFGIIIVMRFLGLLRLI